MPLFHIFSVEMRGKNSFKRMAAHKRKRKCGGASHCNAPHTSMVISNAKEQKLLIFVEMEWRRKKKRTGVGICTFLWYTKKKKQSTAYESAYLLDENLCWSDKNLGMENSCGNLQILCVFAFSPSTLYYVHREIWTAKKSSNNNNNESSSFKGIAKCSQHSAERSKSWPHTCAVPMAFMRGDNN